MYSDNLLGCQPICLRRERVKRCCSNFYGPSCLGKFLFQFEVVGFDKSTSFTMHPVCSVLLNVVLRLQCDLQFVSFVKNLHTHRISVETQLS